ncbi:hypothetical protein H8R18_06440 [Nanchangia anserum]|nr:hypothetical protein H8R18_06440 [Nanchangia anserum]
MGRRRVLCRSAAAEPGRARPCSRELVSPLSYFLDLADSLPGGIKVAPGIDHAALPPDWHAQWTSVDGDLVEACLWSGELAQTGPGRSALVIAETHAAEFAIPDITCANAPNPQVEPAERLAAYLFEPDSALIRAGAIASLASELDARPVFTSIAYLTGNTAPPEHLTPFISQWRIGDVVGLRTKTLKAAMRAWGAGQVTIKKRGVNIDPARLRRAILPKPAGDAHITLACTRVGARHVALRLDPVED